MSKENTLKENLNSALRKTDAICSNKYYNSEHIAIEFEKLNKDDKIKILFEAIDFMQMYNGRSRLMCIALALGYENSEGKVDTYTKRL